MRNAILSLCIVFHLEGFAQGMQSRRLEQEVVQRVQVELPGIPSISLDSARQRNKYGWVRPVIAVGYAGLGVLCYRYADTKIQRFSQSNRSGVIDFISENGTEIGLGKVQAIGLGLSTVTAFLIKNTRLKKTVIIWAGSLVINSTITNQLKNTFQRHRPNTGDAYNVFDWRGGSKFHQSLPSGHTSNIFTTATVFADAYRDKKWVAQWHMV